MSNSHQRQFIINNQNGYESKLFMSMSPNYILIAKKVSLGGDFVKISVN